MATKSVGTLKASLTLDTKGWTAGFDHAERKAKSSTAKISKEVGLGTRLGQKASPALGAAGFGRAGQFAALTAAGPAGAALAAVAAGAFAAKSALRETMRISDEVAKRSHLAAELGVAATQMRRFELAAGLSGKNVKTIIAEFKSGKMSAELSRATAATERFGNLSSGQVGMLKELNAVSKEFGAAWQSIKEQFASSVAPGIVVGLRSILTELERVGSVLKEVGVTWDAVAKSAGGAVVMLATAVRLQTAMTTFDRAAFNDVVTGKFTKGLIKDIIKAGSPADGSGGFASAITGGSVKPITPAPLAQGSVETARFLQQQGANPFTSLDQKFNEFLRQIKRVAENTDPARAEARGGRREVGI